ncbi:MAG: hypothetical protein LBL81_05280 [Tannerella sp.]|nr:hypothetical protein [Tannerella sp.]
MKRLLFTLGLALLCVAGNAQVLIANREKGWQPQALANYSTFQMKGYDFVTVTYKCDRFYRDASAASVLFQAMSGRLLADLQTRYGNLVVNYTDMGDLLNFYCQDYEVYNNGPYTYITYLILSPRNNASRLRALYVPAHYNYMLRHEQPNYVVTHQNDIQRAYVVNRGDKKLDKSVKKTLKNSYKSNMKAEQKRQKESYSSGRSNSGRSSFSSGRRGRSERGGGRR